MKKINLIERLSRNSHEKQKPQRFGRYAVMLLMLLTLGVGQMWADNAGFWDSGAGIITYSKNGGSDTNHSVNKTGASTSDFGTVTAFWLKGWQIKMWKNSSGNICDYGKLYYRIYLTSGSGGSYTELNKASTTWGDNTYHNGGSLNTNLLSGLVGGTYYFEFYFKAQGNWSSSSGCDDKYLSNGGSNYKIKFKYDPKYTVTVSAGSNGSVASTSVTAGNIDAVTLPTATANTGYHFNNWTTASSNLTLGNTTSATTGTVKARAAGTVTANFAANTYTVAYNANDDQYPGTATGSTSSSSHTYGTAKALTSNGFSRAGYTFAGWATTPTGSVAYTNGQSVTNLTSTDGATVTLYAKWTPVTWKLQSTSGDHGTFTGTGPYILDVTYNSATMNWGAARFDLNGTSYICNNYTIGTSEKLDLRAADAYTAISGMTNGASYTFTITYENATWYVQIEEAAAPCTTPTIAWNTTPANGVAGGKMTASVTTNQTSPTITWNSSNTSVATVNSSGVITYVAAGNTRITASYTGDGSTYCSTTASVYQDITVSAAVADAWSLWYWGESETKIGDFTPDGGDSHHLDFELTASNFQTLWLKNNSTQYVATNINANTVTNVTVTESPVGRFRDDATKGYYRFTIYKDGGGAWKLDASPIYRVTYNDNGATSGTAPTDAAGYASGATVTVKGNTGSLAKTGYDFGGWNLSADGSGTNYTAGSGTFSITANTELFAKWNVQNYSIIYKDQGNVAFSGNHVDSPSAHPTTHTYGTATSLNSATKTGYTFGGWFDNSACTGEAVTSLGATAYSDDITLYAKWTENLTTVTINANPAGAGTFTVDASAFTEGNTTTAGVATSRTVVATAQPGYKFSSWSATGNATGTSSTNTYTLKGNGSGSTGTLTANFNRLYAYVQGRFQVKDTARSTTTTTYASGDQWEDSGTKIPMDYDNTNHRFELHTHMTPSELTANHGTGCQDCKPYFFIKTSTSNSSLAGVTTYMCTSAQTLTTAGSANGKTVSSSSGSNTNLRFNSNTTTSYAVVYFDESKIWYELEQRLQYDANGGSGTAPTGDNGHNSYHAKDANATAEANTFTARKNYTFAGWNTAADITGTSYAAGTSVPMSADRILYAKWNRSVTLDQQDATTPGSTSVTATWNCSTLPSITNPQKLGYEFGGWYTETAGNGNIIINTSGQLQANKTNWTVSGGKFQRTPSSDASESKPLYAKWTQTVTLNANLANHGSGDNTSATIVYKATAKTSITHCTPATGYHLEGYYTAATDGTKVLNVDGSFAAATVTDYITDSKWTKAGATTLYAHYEPNTYDVILDVNSATTGSNQTVTATFNADMPTTLKGGSTPISAPSKTGYTFGGYYANSNGTGTQYYTSGLASNHVWDVATNNTTIYAKWTANPYTVTLNINEANHGTIDGKATSASVTFDAAPTAIAAGQLPTAAQGYAFMGFFTAAGGEGVQVINANGTWIASVTGYTDESGHWILADDATLYAYYKKAEITALTITPSTAGLGATVTVTPTIDPMPTGTYQLCWKLLRNNDNEITGTDFDLTSDPDDDPNTVQFTAPSTSGTYKVKCILRTGSSCDGGEELDNMVQSFTVAGEHTVTIRYQDASGRTLAASTEVTGRPLTWSEAIAAPPITGYTFARWEAGDGIILSTNGISELGSNTTTEDPVYVEATYAGNLTAVYNKKNVLYFNNTLGWEHVYVYFYSDGNYWDSNKNKSGTTEEYVFGSGAQTTKTINATTPFSAGHYGEMTRIAGTNIYYFDWQAEGWSHTNYVTFTKDDRYGYEYFDNTEVVRLADAAHYYDKAGTMMMYVPLTSVYEIRNRHDANLTKYYTEGYWMNYPENTGYTLKIFNKVSGDPAPVVVQDIPFEFTGDYTMPMSVTAELEAGRTYGYKIYRNDGSWFGNDGTMTNGASGDEGQTVWEFETGKNNCGLTTSAAGEYTFTLTYAPKSDTYYYLVGVHYPVAVGSYRLVYTDEATTLWSGHTKPANWYHPSRTIEKKDGAKDIISFYVSKETGANASIKVQYAREINASTGAITWADGTDAEHTSVTLDLSGITSSGVYNFHLTQADGSISVEKIEAYTGNYYIRTDCAGTTKWDNYRAADHQMTYSEFSKDRSTNTFGELYTHYYMHWCPRETNIKFVIANDYSMCITDTLESDITDLNNIVSGGYLKSQKKEGKSETDDIYSANIRFMYDERTNKISRAYMSSSTNTARKFLVLKSDTEFKNSDNTALSGSGESATAGNYEAIFKDNEDWIYEREIKLTPGQKFKLYASYAQSTAQEDGSQHFRGNYASNDWASADNYVLLVGGSGGTCNARIVYDFKTNRLISAYLPDNDNAISGSPSINADIMIVRNHQEAGQQITFNTGASLNAVQTVYGVMRFNRWILNNRQNPEDMDRTHSEDNTKMNSHHPLITDPGSQRSSSERGLYWISFPFNVNLSEVFGFGTYGIHWIVMKYNGEERAKQGFWADSEGFWEYIWDRKDVVLEKGKGYVLALDLDRMKADDRTFWNNEIQQVELFFPSTAIVGTIQQTDVDVDVPAWECKIGPRFEGGDDRTKKDSHWNIIGVPSYANYNSELTDGSATITWNANPETQDLPFLYEWNANDNTYTVQSGTSYPFKAMHAYYVQYHGTLHWSLASATPPSIVARRAYEKPQNEEFRLELQQNEKMVDQTFVKLSNDENASADFRFEEDLCKEFNSRKANIYTFIADVQAAGNTLPLSDQTTLVPVGVKTTVAGEYTFAMPEGTNGVGVVLVDNIAGTRTNLALSDYTVALGKGDLSDRFMLEIAPIKQMPTDIENVQGGDVQGAKARKVMIDGILYIVKDGKVFDARGAKVK